MLTPIECQEYRSFVERYQSYIYPLLGAHIARMLGNVGRVIDLGTGPGYLSAELAERCGGPVHAVDINPAMHEIARRTAADRAVTDKISFDLEDVHELRYPACFADAVVSYSCFHHWAHPARALSEIYRVLSPGGKLVIIDTNPLGSDFLQKMNQFIVEPQYFRFVAEALAESYSQAQVAELAAQAGVAGFSLGDFEFTEEDFLECVDQLADAPFLDDTADARVCWVLTATKADPAVATA